MGCRARREADELVRVVVDDGAPVIGRPGTGGRGAWLCPTAECVELAGRRSAFSRAFRSGIADSYFAATLLDWLTEPGQS